MCNVGGRFVAPERRFQIMDRVDRSLRVSFLAGLSPRKGGFGSRLARIITRVYRSWQVYHPEVRFRIVRCVDHSARVPKPADLTPRGGGFGS